MKYNICNQLYFHIVFSFLILLIGIFGLWIINDIFGCGRITGNIDICGIENIFFKFNSNIAFHIGLVLSLTSITSLFLMLLLLLKCIIFSKYSKNAVLDV